jgi:hypothetical protein
MPNTNECNSALRTTLPAAGTDVRYELELPYDDVQLRCARRICDAHIGRRCRSSIPSSAFVIVTHNDIHP